MAENPYGTALTRYHSEGFSADSVKALANLIGFESRLQLIRKYEAQTLPIMCGIVLYRQLSPIQQRDVLQRIQNLPPESGLVSAFRGLLATSCCANPYWHAWSLSNEELRTWYAQNKDVRKLIDKLGIDLSTNLSAAAVIGFLYSVSKEGIKAHLGNVGGVKAVSGGAEEIGFGKRAARSLGLAYVAAALAATFVKLNAEAAEKAGEKELLRRGRLKTSDL